MAIVHVTKENYEAEVLNAQVPVLLDFWAEWCGPCKMLAPILDRVDATLTGQAKICKINVDEASELATQFGIMSIPTLVLMENGAEQSRAVGLRGEADIKKMLNIQ